MFRFWQADSKSNLLKQITTTLIRTGGSLIGLIQTIFGSIFDLLFPLKCMQCQKLIAKTNQKNSADYPVDYKADKNFSENLFKNYFCPECIAQSYEPFKPPFCKRCGKKFQHNFTQNHFCEDCLKGSNVIRKVRAGARYTGIVKESIHFFKYQKKLALARPLEKIIFKGLIEYFKPPEIDVIIPVPLHASKLRQRGFNQSFLVVKNFKKMLEKNNIFSQLEIDLDSLKRVKKTGSQTNFSPEQRKENVKNAFKVVKSERIKDKKILLVDDVYTTGATSMEAAAELLNSGALSVDVLVIAVV
ncbi:MAG: ComF family protein [Desulfobacteraceae bacterium]|nr:ComF family protein [Desulfobacteraceae bacterium]